MRSLFPTTLALAIILSFASHSEARLIQGGFFFAANDGSDVSSISQTVTAAGGNVTFTFDVTISVNGGAAYDTTAGNGIAGTVGGSLGAGDVVTYGLSFSGVVQNGPHRIHLDKWSFRFLGTEAANGIGSSGTLTTPSGSSGTAWIDANGPGADFGGHLPGITTFGSGDAEGYVGGTSVAAIDAGAGFDIPRSEIANGGAFGTDVLTFSHEVDAGSYRLNDLIVQVRATPEPSSFALGFVALASGGVYWRRRKQNTPEADDTEQG